MKSTLQNTGLKMLLTLASLVIIFAGIKAASQLIVPFLLACFLSIVLYPLVRYSAKHSIPPAISIGVIMLVIVSLFFAVSGVLGSSLNDFARSLPASRDIIIEKIRVLQTYSATFGIDISTEEMLKYLDPADLLNFIKRLLSSFSNVMAGIFLLLMTMTFILLEVNALPNKLHKIMSEPEAGMANVSNAIQSITRYVAIKTIVSLLTGALVWIFLSCIGIKFALLWGMLAFLLNYIPNIGSVLAAAAPILQALVLNSFADALLVSGGFIAINIVLGNIIEPKVMGKGLGLSTLVVFLSLLFWGWLLGPVGMLLSVPLTIVIKIILENVHGGEKLAILLGNGK